MDEWINFESELIWVVWVIWVRKIVVTKIVRKERWENETIGITKITKDNEDNEKLIKKLILAVDKITTKITNRKWVDSWIAKFF